MPLVVVVATRSPGNHQFQSESLPLRFSCGVVSIFSALPLCGAILNKWPLFWRCSRCRGCHRMGQDVDLPCEWQGSAEGWLSGRSSQGSHRKAVACSAQTSLCPPQVVLVLFRGGQTAHVLRRERRARALTGVLSAAMQEHMTSVPMWGWLDLGIIGINSSRALYRIFS